MYKIGIIGHGPERLVDSDKVQRLVGYTIDLLGFQYGKDDTVFNITGSTGVGLWSAEECMKQGYRYHLFLPNSVQETSKHWFDEQKDSLLKYYNQAYSLTICNPGGNNKEKEYKRLVEQSNFVVFFWEGMKHGEIADAVRYSCDSNKLALNAMDDLKLIDVRDIRKNRKKKNGRK